MHGTGFAAAMHTFSGIILEDAIALPGWRPNALAR